MAFASVRRFAWRYWLQQVHLWVGLILCIPLVVLGITGSVLVYGHDLEHLLGHEEPRATTTGTKRSPGEIAAAAMAAAPPGFVVISVRMPDEPGDPAGVRLNRPIGGRNTPGGAPGSGPPAVSPFAGSVQLLIDPVSLEVLGKPAPPPQWLRFLHNLHGNFLIPGRDGRLLVGWMGVAMLALGLSGLILWWPRTGRWRAAFTVKKGARGVRLHRDLHGAVGIWSFVIFMVVSFSGVYLAFPRETAAVINAIFPGRDLRAASIVSVKPVRDAQRMSIDDAVAVAREAVGGDAEFRLAFMPMRPDQPYRINLIRAGYSESAPMITVLIDPWAARVLDVQDPRTFTFGKTIAAWQRALHYGLGLGKGYKFLVFLSGLIIPLFAVTGAFMWILKRRARRAAMRPTPRNAG